MLSFTSQYLYFRALLGVHRRNYLTRKKKNFQNLGFLGSRADRDHPSAISDNSCAGVSIYINLCVPSELLLCDSSSLETLKRQYKLRNMSDQKKGEPFQQIQTEMSFIRYNTIIDSRTHSTMPFTDALAAPKHLPP